MSRKLTGSQTQSCVCRSRHQLKRKKAPVQTKPLATQISRLVQREAQQPLEEEEEKVVATKPLVQRVPVAVREDEEEKKVAPKLEPGAELQDEEEEKPVQAKLETDTAIRRQAMEDEEKEEEPLQSTPPVQRQMEDEDEETVQTKPLSSAIVRFNGYAQNVKEKNSRRMTNLPTWSNGSRHATNCMTIMMRKNNKCSQKGLTLPPLQ